MHRSPLMNVINSHKLVRIYFHCSNISLELTENHFSVQITRTSASKTVSSHKGSQFGYEWMWLHSIRSSSKVQSFLIFILESSMVTSICSSCFFVGWWEAWVCFLQLTTLSTTMCHIWFIIFWQNMMETLYLLNLFLDTWVNFEDN